MVVAVIMTMVVSVSVVVMLVRVVVIMLVGVVMYVGLRPPGFLPQAYRTDRRQDQQGNASGEDPVIELRCENIRQSQVPLVVMERRHQDGDDAERPASADRAKLIQIVRTAVMVVVIVGMVVCDDRGHYRVSAAGRPL